MTDLRDTDGRLPFSSSFDRTITVDLADLGRIVYALGIVERGLGRQIDTRAAAGKSSDGMVRELADVRRLRVGLEAEKPDRDVPQVPICAGCGNVITEDRIAGVWRGPDNSPYCEPGHHSPHPA